MFIALGVMLLFSIGTLYAFKSIGQDFGKFKPYIEEVPTDVQPVKRFVEKCIEDTAKEGLRKLGAQGGYIDIQELGILITPEPTSSEGVEFVPGINVPYWYHMKSPNTCTGACSFDQSLTPNNRKIESQLAEYVQENLQYCTRQFEQFPKFTIKDEDPEVEANIGISNVQVNVLYPLEVNTGSRDTEITKFFSAVDLNLGKILDAARSIAKVELEHKFLEYNDIELITTYSGVDANLLPPFSASEMEMKSVFWTTLQVKEKLQNLLEEKYMMLQAESARNTVEPILKNIEYQGTAKQVYRNLIVPFDYTSGLNVNFHYYSNWPIFLSLNSNSGVVMPEQIMPSIIPGLSMAIERYSTVYDLSHPVVIELEDPDALKGEGYTFRFALEANIRGNEPLKFENNPEFAVPVEGSMMCDPDKRNSGDVHLQVRDSITNDPVSNVNIFFNSVDSCVMGKTDENGELTTQFPVGIGTLGLIHPDYLSFVSPDFVTELDAGKEAGIFRLKPLKSTKVKSEVFQLDRTGINSWAIGASPRVINEKESVMVVLERKRNLESEPEFKKVAIFDKESTQDEIELVEGDYNVNIILMYDGNFTVPENLRCFKIKEGLLKKSKCQWVYLPGPGDMVMPMPALEYATSLTVYKQDLYKETPITFYGLFANLPDAQGLQIEEINIFENLAERYKYKLVPRK